VDNYSLINEMADLYNAEKLKEYCNWFYRRHCSLFNNIDHEEEEVIVGEKE
jgi:hypothetical protein